MGINLALILTLLTLLTGIVVAMAEATGQAPEPIQGTMSPELAAELSAMAAPGEQGGLAESQGAEKLFGWLFKSGDQSAYENSAAKATVKDPASLTTVERIYAEKMKDVGEGAGDGPYQQAARLMELQRGLPPRSCLVRHDTGKVACNKNADAVREERRRILAEAAPAPATNAQPVTVKRLGTGKSRSAGGNCGAGKFCKAGQ